MRTRGRYSLPEGTRPSVFRHRHKVMVSDVDLVIWFFGALSLVCCAAYLLSFVASLL